MSSRTKFTDAKGRLLLPSGFANATVLVERISDSELRIRKARVIPEDEVVFAEETSTPLSDRDRDRFLKLLAKPPRPTAALKKLLAGRKARCEL